MTRVGFDTNILVYLSGVIKAGTDAAKADTVDALFQRLVDVAHVVVPAQALGELAVVLNRSGFTRAATQERVGGLATKVLVAPTTAQTLHAALAFASDHALQMWDSVIFTAAAEAGCALLLSEDMQHGFTASGVTIVNPLVAPMHPRLAALLN